MSSVIYHLLNRIHTRNAAATSGIQTGILTGATLATVTVTAVGWQVLQTGVPGGTGVRVGAAVAAGVFVAGAG